MKSCIRFIWVLRNYRNKNTFPFIFWVESLHVYIIQREDFLVCDHRENNELKKTRHVHVRQNKNEQLTHVISLTYLLYAKNSVLWHNTILNVLCRKKLNKGTFSFSTRLSIIHSIFYHRKPLILRAFDFLSLNLNSEFGRVFNIFKNSLLSMMIICSMFQSKSNRNQKSAFLLLLVAVEIKSIEYEAMEKEEWRRNGNFAPVVRYFLRRKLL